MMALVIALLLCTGASLLVIINYNIIYNYH